MGHFRKYIYNVFFKDVTGKSTSINYNQRSGNT